MTPAIFGINPAFIVLAILILFVIGMLSGKFPFGVVALGCCFLLALTQVIEPLDALAGFSDKNVYMLAGMYIVAYAFGKTSFIEMVKNKLLSGNMGKSSYALVASILIISALFAQIMMATANIMIMITFLSSFEDSEDVTISRMILPVTFIATCWLGKIPLGGGAASYLIYNGLIESAGGTPDMMLNVFSTLKATWLPSVAALIYCILTYKMLPAKAANTSKMALTQQRGPKAAKPDRVHEILIYIGFVVSILGMVIGPVFGNIAYLIPGMVAIFFLLTGCIDQREALGTLMNDSIFMIAGVLVIADAITTSGLGAMIGELLISLLGSSFSPLKLMIIGAIVSAILTTFTSNAATIYVLVPVISSICITAGFDPRACIMCVVSCSVASIITPMASSGAALAYGVSGITMKESWKWSVPLCLLMVVTSVINAAIAYPM